MALGLIFLRQRLHAGMCEACSKSRRRLQKKKDRLRQHATYVLLST